jgi:hypothetical protein
VFSASTYPSSNADSGCFHFFEVPSFLCQFALLIPFLFSDTEEFTAPLQPVRLLAGLVFDVFSTAPTAPSLPSVPPLVKVQLSFL